VGHRRSLALGARQSRFESCHPDRRYPAVQILHAPELITRVHHQRTFCGLHTRVTSGAIVQLGGHRLRKSRIGVRLSVAPQCAYGTTRRSRKAVALRSTGVFLAPDGDLKRAVRREGVAPLRTHLGPSSNWEDNGMACRESRFKSVWLHNPLSLALGASASPRRGIPLRRQQIFSGSTQRCLAPWSGEDDPRG
jgi:hypothetical protein